MLLPYAVTARQAFSAVAPMEYDHDDSSLPCRARQKIRGAALLTHVAPLPSTFAHIGGAGGAVVRVCHDDI